MYGIFDFFSMAGTYKTRKVGRWDSKDGKRVVSTAAVTDGSHPYETAFMHPDYNGGEMVIVEAYDTKEAAEAGHARWVKVMTKGPLPKILTDCNNSHISQLGATFGCQREFKRKTKKTKTRKYA